MIIVVRVESPPAPVQMEIAFKSPECVYIGRDPKSDVRLPDASVSLRHASIRRQGAGYAVVDERSTNGTFVNQERLASGAWQSVADGDKITVGRAVLLVRFELKAATSTFSTQDLALAMVQGTLQADGAETAPRVRVREGPDTGLELVLDLERTYVLGRDSGADLMVTDEDASRRHTRIVRRGGRVWVGDLGSKNGTRLDGVLVPDGQLATWSESGVLEVGRNKLTLDDPVSSALRRLERAPDERLAGESRAEGSGAWQAAAEGSVGAAAAPPNFERSWARVEPGVLPAYSTMTESRGVLSHSTSMSSSAPSAPIEALPQRETEIPVPKRVRRPLSTLDLFVIGIAVVTIVASVLALAWFLTG